VDQRAEAADGNAHQPDRLVALGALRLDDVGVQPIAERLVVVVGNVRVHQQRIGRQVALPHGADEAFALELVGLEVRARQKISRASERSWVGGLRCVSWCLEGAPDPHRHGTRCVYETPTKKKVLRKRHIM
jgi:hypothetical protein